MARVEPLRLEHLPRYSRREVAALHALLRRVPLPFAGGAPAPAGPVALRLGSIALLASAEILLRERDAALLWLVRGRERAALCVDAALAVRLAWRALGADDAAELAAPRPLSPAERGALVYVAASTLTRLGSDARVAGAAEPTDLATLLPPAPNARAFVVDLAVHAHGASGSARLVLPEAFLSACPDMTLEYPTEALDRLPVRLRAERTARVLREDLAAVEEGGVVVLPDGPPRLRCGRVVFPARDGARAGTLTIADEAAMSEHLSASPAALADALEVELSAVVGSVTMSARAATELRPGAVVELHRPLGGAVDLLVGGRAFARGELVDVDGQVGVRVTELLFRPV